MKGKGDGRGAELADGLRSRALAKDPKVDMIAEFTVPADARAGENVVVDLAGQLYNVAVPPGCMPGQICSVQIPYLYSGDDEHSL